MKIYTGLKNYKILSEEKYELRDDLKFLGEFSSEIDFGDTLEINGLIYKICSATCNKEGGYSEAIAEEIILNDKDEIGETCESELTCPVCGYEESDSWELSDSEEDHECGGCGAVLSYERDFTVEYRASLVEYPDVKKIK